MLSAPSGVPLIVMTGPTEATKNEAAMALEHSHHNEEAIAAELVRAHLSGQGVADSALAVPANAMCAMRVQAIVQERLALPVKGWKVAIGPEKTPIAAPLLNIYPDASEIRLFQGCTIEVELGVRLRKDLPRRAAGAYLRPDILDAIESLFLGIEVIGGRFASAANVPFLAFLADNLGNRAYVIGDGLPVSAVEQANGLACHVTLDGKPLHHAPASHPAGDPLLPLLAYANEQSDYLGGLRAGQVVTTGSLCGVLPVEAADLLRAHLGNIGQISLRFTK